MNFIKLSIFTFEGENFGLYGVKLKISQHYKEQSVAAPTTSRSKCRTGIREEVLRIYFIF
jgi:hypothetical protein